MAQRGWIPVVARVVGFLVGGGALIGSGGPARAEHCWLYVDGFDYGENKPTTPNFPGFEFTKAPFQCVHQDFTPNCSWEHGQACTVGGTCCTSVPDPAHPVTVLKMHEMWHKCFGSVGRTAGDPPPFEGRSARWLAFHRQFEFDFDLFREAEFGCGPGSCNSGVCSNNSGLTCTTDIDCDDTHGCFIEAMDWHKNMVYPYGHPGAGPEFASHPAGCGTGVKRPNDITCTSCQPLPACLYNSGSGPLNGDPPTNPNAANCLGFQGSRLEQLPSLDVVADILDSSHHANFHSEVGHPFEGSCVSDADCVVAGGPSCDPTTHVGCPVCDVAGQCAYSQDVFAPACSPRDPMFWRLHKRLDDTVRAWQEKRPFDLSVVIDRSGSMSETDSSGKTKIQVVTDALRMLADLLPDAQSSTIGVVSYSNSATEDLPPTPASGAAAAIQSVADGIEARVGGCTSIGNGVKGAIAQICHRTSTDPATTGQPSCNANDPLNPGQTEGERKGILLLTDGMENRSPCLRSAAATDTPTCGDTCGGEQFDFGLLGANTQLCAIGFGQAGSINGNLLTLTAERQGGIYMQSPAKGANDDDGLSGQGRFVDLKDFFVKCFGQLSDEFVGIDPKGTLHVDELSTEPVNYSTCDDEKLTFVAGWKEAVASGALRLMVNAPSGALVRFNDPAVESSAKGKYTFLRAPLPLNGESAGTWRAQLIRPHGSYVNGFTTDSLPSSVSVPLVRTQIQRICPNGCAHVLYFEDGHHGAASSYQDALNAEVATGLVGSVTHATDASDFNTQLGSSTSWNLIVYAHQMTEGAEPYDTTLQNKVCVQNQPIIVTDTRGLDNINSTPPPGDPNVAPFFINSCAGGTPFGAADFTQIVGDGRLLIGTHNLVNNGYTHFSYGQIPLPFGGPTQALAFGPDGLTLGAISATTFEVGCSGEFCDPPIEQDWFMDVLVRGHSQLDDSPARFTYRTGESGLLATARVLPANIPQGGYDQVNVNLELERPTVGIGRTLLNVGQQPGTATPTADGEAGRAAALRATTPIATVTQSFAMNDDGLDGDLLAQNGYWSRRVVDSNTPGQCLVDGMYRMHFTADFTKNGCTTRRELVRSTFVDVGVDPTASNLTVSPTSDGMLINICPQDRCGNPSGWGRHITCGPAPGCSCAPSDIVDHGDGCYTITVHAAATQAACTVDGTGKPVSIQSPVSANAGPDQTVECSANGATVQLDGSGSHAGDGGPLSFLWSAPGITFSDATAAQPTARFPVGSTTVTLRVTSPASGAVRTDTVLITVADTQPPVMQVPPDITISTCRTPNIGTATANDACRGSVPVSRNAPTLFPLGVTVVTYTASDGAGHTSTGTQRVTAILGDDRSCCPPGTNVIIGTSNNDTLNGTAGSDCILGLGAQDHIFGQGGNDFISGGEGDDVIDGGSGNDQIWGGNGQDTITGGIGNDMLDGGGGDDVCRGGDGDDVLHGGQGQDHLFGENGNDQLFGETGDDTLDGGPGNDALNGGGLHDVCIGGGGTDTFVTCETQR